MTEGRKMARVPMMSAPTIKRVTAQRVRRLVSGEIRTIRPKYRAIRGVVNSMAPRVTPTLAQRMRYRLRISLQKRLLRFSLFRTGRSMDVDNRADTSKIPATEAKDSWRLTLAAEQGF